MDKSMYLEKNISQQPAIDLLRSMGYTYITPEDCEVQRGSRYHVLLKDILRGQLRRIPIENGHHQFRLELKYLPRENPAVPLFVKELSNYLKNQ